ncbi:kinase-like domain-containing protein [Dactylonectria macrodidyma]|uniref:EKC/KEOPS complex subunit BUD32 n=1 Tax=Dactylonectria macrodidyma TaxID=307937 RepID=A0A9P9JLW7_9HYPO|nr:kinase-like domain-containing protein [Dactylonectria macrodidyma]
MRTTKPTIRPFDNPKRGSCVVNSDIPLAPERLWRRLYVRTLDDDLENLRGFQPGGYHPIQLHDELHDGQYRVIHKLGHGGSSTVWPCQEQHVDTPSYVAIKILVASETERDCRELLMTSKLHLEGIDKSQSPNGTYICLVSPVSGPVVREAAKLTFVSSSEESDPGALHKDFSEPVAGALAALHSRGICHGDFRPSNILLGLDSLEGLHEEQVLSRIGKPQTRDVHIRKDTRPTPEVPYAPKHLVYPLNIYEVDPSLLTLNVRAIDFGQSFDTTQRPLPVAFGILVNYAAPEVVLDSVGSRRLFDVF